jgi:NitT/TauT family transport system permease protein
MKLSAKQHRALVALGAAVACWCCGSCCAAAFNVSEFIFPSPGASGCSWSSSRARSPRHAWRTFWVTMAGLWHRHRGGRAAGLPDRQLAPGLHRHLPADDRLQRPAQGGLRAHPGGVVRHRRGAGGADRLPDQLLPITVNIATGLATLEPELEDVLRVLGAKRWDVLVKVGLPRSMPYFYGSLKVAITLAFVGTTVSEMTAGNEGIGYLLHQRRQQHADGPGLCRPGDHGRDGHGDVRAVQLWSRSAPPAGRTAAAWQPRSFHCVTW